MTISEISKKGQENFTNSSNIKLEDSSKFKCATLIYYDINQKIKSKVKKIKYFINLSLISSIY